MEKNYLKKTPIKKDKHKWIENLNEYGRLRRLYFSDALIIIGIGIIWWAWNDVF